MAQIPDKKLKIEKAIEEKMYDTDLRPYLGISYIADNCARKIWYNFRWCSREKIEARKVRLFNRGHREEPIILEDLQKAGVIVLSTQEECTAIQGHCKGHSDGRIVNLPDAPKTEHLLEIKTGNDKNFKATKKNGVKNQHPVYYGQMICYMREFKLTRGLFIMVNKNDDERYYERVYENKEQADLLFKRAEDIVSTEFPPEKIGNANWYQCKYCVHYDVCHFNGTPLKNCRTCYYGDIHNNGVWRCSKHNIEITPEQQKLGCGGHVFLKTLIQGIIKD